MRSLARLLTLITALVAVAIVAIGVSAQHSTDADVAVRDHGGAKGNAFTSLALSWADR